MVATSKLDCGKAESDKKAKTQQFRQKRRGMGSSLWSGLSFPEKAYFSLSAPPWEVPEIFRDKRNRYKPFEYNGAYGKTRSTNFTGQRSLVSELRRGIW